MGCCPAAAPAPLPHPDGPAEVPEEAEDVTTEWLAAALRGSALVPDGCEVFAAGGGNGNGNGLRRMSNSPMSGAWIRRVEFDVGRPGEAQRRTLGVVVKAMHLPKAGREYPMVEDKVLPRLAMRAHNYTHETLMLREADFYAKGGRAPPAWRYVCCGATQELSTVLVFEDLSRWRGHETDLPQHFNYTLFMYRSAALTQAVRRRLSPKLAQRYCDLWLLTLLPVAAERGAPPPSQWEAREAAAAVARNSALLRRRSRALRSAQETVVHGDFHGGNVLYPPADGGGAAGGAACPPSSSAQPSGEGGSCCLIDWQLWGRAPAALEVAYFLTAAVRPEDDQRVLRAYHAALVAGVMPP
eukprot:gene16624-7496_t